MRFALVIVLLAGCADAAQTPPPETERLFGHITAVDATTLTVAELQFLTGEAAAIAYREDTGQVGGPPNDFWIRDLQTSRRLEVTPDASIIGLGYDASGNPSPIPLRLTELAAAVSDPTTSGLYWTDAFWLDLVDGEVVRIEAQYLP